MKTIFIAFLFTLISFTVARQGQTSFLKTSPYEKVQYIKTTEERLSNWESHLESPIMKKRIEWNGEKGEEILKNIDEHLQLIKPQPKKKEQLSPIKSNYLGLSPISDFSRKILENTQKLKIPKEAKSEEKQIKYEEVEIRTHKKSVLQEIKENSKKVATKSPSNDDDEEKSSKYEAVVLAKQDKKSATVKKEKDNFDYKALLGKKVENPTIKQLIKQKATKISALDKPDNLWLHPKATHPSTIQVKEEKTYEIPEKLYRNSVGDLVPREYSGEETISSKVTPTIFNMNSSFLESSIENTHEYDFSLED